MKIIFVFLFLFLFSSVHSQWMQQPLGTTAAIERVKFLNNNTGWCCGAGGFLRKTTDGGANWIPVSNPAGGKYLADLFLIDANIIYVVGDFETILKTTNGGTNWNEIRNGPFGAGNSYEACYFLNVNTGWVSGRVETPMKIFKTTNGGVSFDSTIILQGSDITDIYFKNESEGLASGWFRDLYKTTNGGASWFNCQINLPTNWPSFLRMSFVNEMTGYVPAGDGRVFKSTNFGTSWDTVSKIQGIGNFFMACIEFVNINTGWVGGDAGLLFKTTNGGINWKQEAVGFGSFLDLNFVTDSIGWICGTPGKIFKTTTAGQTIVSVTNEVENIKDFELSQNYPNPFNPTTTIKFSTKNKSNYKLEIYNSQGKLVSELFDRELNAGEYEYKFDGASLTSGVYFYKIETPDFVQTKRMVLVK